MVLPTHILNLNLKHSLDVYVIRKTFTSDYCNYLGLEFNVQFDLRPRLPVARSSRVPHKLIPSALIPYRFYIVTSLSRLDPSQYSYKCWCL